MERFLTALAGARQEILARCSTERLKFQSLGWAMLITSGIATVSMWFALTSVLGINAILAFPIAILWGLAILGIDRWLVISIPPRGSRRLGIALPRLVLAILLGSLISTPIVLRIFQSEINNEIIKIDAQQQNSFVAQQQHDTVSQQVAYWQARVTSLQSVISSHGQESVNPSTDPVTRELTGELNYWAGQKAKYLQLENCELYGGPGCPAGNGPMAQQYKQSAQQAQRQVTTLNQEISARQQELSADNAKSAGTRLKQAQSALPQAEQELSNYRTQQDTLRNANYATLPKNGLLIRLEALNVLSAGNFTVNAARFLIFLFFLVIECLPVTVKLLQRPGIYENILEEQAKFELREARRAIRGGGSDIGPGAASFAEAYDPAGATAPQSTLVQPGAPPVADRRMEALQEIWGAPDDGVTAKPSPSFAEQAGRDENGTRSRLDRVLRGMTDTRPVIPEGPVTELGYEDGDL